MVDGVVQPSSSDDIRLPEALPANSALCESNMLLKIGAYQDTEGNLAIVLSL